MSQQPTFDDFDDCFDYADDFEEPLSVTPLSPETLASMSLLDKLEHLINATRGCELKQDALAPHKDLIQSVADALFLTPDQTIMLIPFINSSGELVDTRDLQRYFNCSPIAIMRHDNDLKALVRRRYLQNNGFRRHEGNRSLTEKAKRALCDNHGLPVIKTTNLTPAEFMNLFRKLLLELEERHHIDQDEFYLEAVELMEENPHLKIVQALNNLPICDEEKVVLLVFCKSLAINGEPGLPLNHFDDYYHDFYAFTEAMVKKVHPFVTEGLLTQFVKTDLFSHDFFGLTKKGRKLLLSEYVIPRREFDESFEHSHLIKNKDIKSKTLFYSAEDQGQINTLKGLLEDNQLKAIRKRLEEAHLRKGFNCLFYGLPGTGKTETALQLARMTQRDIMQVDISSMRDKWYGETEKIVRQIFEEYDELVKHSKRIPILLINEADALLSVRTNIGSNNPTIEKTENAIQNILLESMENLDGILIATTNLTCNLDSAFERRFLYKVEFHQPSIEAKTNIWKIFLPSLGEQDAFSLAQSYDFSGGQIENIARKVMVDQLLFGTSPDIDRIMELCTHETLVGTNIRQRHIGFN